MEVMQDEKCYTIREACKITGAKVRTVRGWIHEGKIGAFKFSNDSKWYIPEFELPKLRGIRVYEKESG